MDRYLFDPKAKERKKPLNLTHLLQMLVTLECLQIGTAKKTRVTLFSKSSSSKPGQFLRL